MTDPRASVIVALQRDKTAAWHQSAPQVAGAGFLGLVEENHLRNFLLWHEEDKARRDDRGERYVYDAKRAIDRYNQQRNDFIERIDDALATRFGPFDASVPMNSETPAMIVDRLSILTLKEFHMAEEAAREDASTAHRAACADKVATIRRQLDDLAHALQELLDDMASGRRGFRLYRQFKMYNDPTLNPQLYRRET